MSELVLTIDLGNSAGKLRLWRVPGPGGAAPECVRRGEIQGNAELPERLAAWIAAEGGAAPGRAVLASVAAPALERRVARAIAGCVGALVIGPPAGLANRCRSPESTGADRLYAARGALAVVGRSAIVVDAGTALTVDAVRALPARAAEGAGELLGGAIAPGPALCARALAEGTARLPRVEPRPGVPALGRETAEAIRAGLGIGFRGAARELAREVAREAGLEGAPVVLTGGASSFLLEPGPFVPGELVREPDLVHRGLLAALLAGRGAAQ
ncbi:MAG: type III pantothenate kinase [Planctomycetota bacterium]